jgi:integrase/ribosomal protein L40E
VRFLEKHPKVSPENKRKILEFLEYIKAEGLSLARQVSYVQWMTTIAVVLGKDFNDSTRQDVEKLLVKLNGRDWADATKENHREAVKKFWRWLKGVDDGKDPEETEWFKVGKHKPKEILPEELLSRDEANSLIEAADHPRDRAYAAVSDESGARPSEILSMRIRSVVFDQYGAVIIVNGKTGERRIRLITSAPLLATWLENHPKRMEPSEPVWVNVGSTRHGGIFDYNAARKLLRELGKKANVRKRIYPYLFRHSTATYLANHLTEAQMCTYFGWKQGSRMPSYYVHLSGRDIDERMLELHGIKQETQERLKDTVKICGRCNTKNAPVAKFCSRCGLALDLKASLDTDLRIAKAEEGLEILLSNSEVRSFLVAKMRELDLVEKLA